VSVTVLPPILLRSNDTRTCTGVCLTLELQSIAAKEARTKLPDKIRRPSTLTQSVAGLRSPLTSKYPDVVLKRNSIGLALNIHSGIRRPRLGINSRDWTFKSKSRRTLNPSVDLS